MSGIFTSGRAISEFRPETAMLIGRALALLLQNHTGRPAKILIGRDTRVSGEIIEASFAAGCCSYGADAVSLGVIPAPAVSYLIGKYSADAGVMITAAHNSYEYTGIRIFGPDGCDLAPSLQSEVERLVTSAPREMVCPGGEQIGKISYEKNGEWDYVRHLMKQIDADLGRTKIVIDAANGAAFSCAEKFFRGIGATVIMINNNPDGKNINRDCGVVDIEPLRKCVLDNHCHAGIALDGDGGRCVMVDEKGEVIISDRLTAILALYMKSEQKLSANTCVVLQSTNLGFFRWAKENGIVVSAAPGVGSAAIVERMLVGDYSLGGSSTGHIVIGGFSKTADGELAAAKILEIMIKNHKKMSELAGVFEPYPELHINVKIRPEYIGCWQEVPQVAEIIEFCQQKLEGDGRVLVRESEAEPVLRITAEGRDRDIVYQYANAIAQTAQEAVGYPE